MHYYDKNALKLSHLYLEEHIKKGAICVDATMGRGRDTLLLSQLTGEEGHVFAFDIQEDAIQSTRALLSENGRENITLILDSHDKMREYVNEADAVIFNFGFLPGGDHSIFSHPEVSCRAIDAALSILKPEGFISLCIYYGGDTGFEERDGILKHLAALDQKKYTVMLQSFHNRKNCPPLFAVVEINSI